MRKPYKSTAQRRLERQNVYGALLIIAELAFVAGFVYLASVY